jgi:hypothetical protein
MIFVAAALISPLLLGILAILSFLLAYGLLKGRPWAWTGAIILTAVWIIATLVEAAIGLVGTAIIYGIINAVIIYYLTRQHVRTFFGK